MASNGPRLGSGLINHTPRASPHPKPTPSRSLVKASDLELNLSLKKVIGSTSRSNCSFDCLNLTKSIAYTAGADVVLATIQDDHSVSQRFFKIRPGAQSMKISTPSCELISPLGTSPGLRPRPANRSRGGSVGNSYFTLPTKEASDSPLGRKFSFRERIKATTCVSLSSDGKLLAVGETGHKPRVLIFSTKPDASTDFPLATLSEHSFGVRCVAFSPDSQYLATLGELNDGFLHVWSIDGSTGYPTLHASNKCTSNIRSTIWLGNALITLGTRHVKVWRIETAVQETSQKRSIDTGFGECTKALAGRNCLLGPLLDQTFTCAVPISTNKAILCSEQGDICLLVDTDLSPQFVKIAETDFSINAVVVAAGKRLVVGGHGSMVFGLDDVLNYSLSAGPSGLIQGIPWPLARPPCQINAMAWVDQLLITLDGQMTLTIFDASNHDFSNETAFTAMRLQAHGTAVLGVRRVPGGNRLGVDFFTWSADGLVLFWDHNGVCQKSVRVLLDPFLDGVEYSNELKVVRLCQGGAYLTSGDRSGRLKILDCTNDNVLHDIKAHTGEITDISIHEDDAGIVIVTCGRDRMIQVHHWVSHRFELVQTLDEHVGSVNRVLFNNNSTCLVSCSSDRNVVVWDVIRSSVHAPEAMVFLKARNIVLKSTPLSLALSKTESGVFLVSTNDKQVVQYDMRSGSLVSRFKLSDSDGEDSIAMGTIVQFAWDNHDCLIAGISNTDKSIRIYDEVGRLVACEYGHTEGLTGFIVLESTRSSGGKSIVTTGTDGTVFMWHLSSRNSAGRHAVTPERVDEVDNAVTPMGKLPLRRVLSSAEITRLQEFRMRQDSSKSVNVHTSETPSHSRKPSKLSISQTPDGKTSKPKQALESPTRATIGGPDRKGSMRSSALVPTKSKEQSVAVNSASSSTPGAQESPNAKKSLSDTAGCSELNALVLATEQVCRTLHNYRKKLSGSHDVLPAENARDVERELSLTAKAVAEKATRSETIMTKLLDEYSERLVGLLDEKIEASVARQIGGKAQHSH